MADVLAASELRPSFKNSFKPREVKAVLKEVLHSTLSEKKYDPNETSNWTKEIAAQIRSKLKALEIPRYKHIVQVVIGENKGAGVQVGCRCLWDASTDKLAEETFANDSIWCVAVAFGVYLY